MNSVCASSTAIVAHHVLRLQRQLALQGLLRRALDRLGALELGGEHIAAAAGVLQVDPGAIELGPGNVDQGIGDRQRGLGFVDLGCEAARIDQGERLILGDGVVEIDIDPGKLPGQLGTDLDRLDRLQGTRDGDGLLDAAALDRGIAEQGRIRPEGRDVSAGRHEQAPGRVQGVRGPLRSAPGHAGDGNGPRDGDCGEAACSSEQGNDWYKSHIKARLFEMASLAAPAEIALWL
ncbi:hypothetical protein ACU4GH_35665 [Bradyrhizobium betae]